MNAASGLQTTRNTSITCTTTTTQATTPNAPVQPLPTTGQSVLLFPEQPRSHGTPCEVARMLQARCEALATR